MGIRFMMKETYEALSLEAGDVLLMWDSYLWGYLYWFVEANGWKSSLPHMLETIYSVQG